MPDEVLSLADVLEQELEAQGFPAARDADSEYRKAKESHDSAASAVRKCEEALKKAWPWSRSQARGTLEKARKSKEAADRIRLSKLTPLLGCVERSALCISGGGIRSATFGLGALQGLSHYNLLSKFDYVSTVSGGGYIGSWLSAWLTHEQKNNKDITAIERELSSPTPGAKLEPERSTVEYLRSYSKYLSPQTGLLAADTWTLVATVLRNMLLNWLVIVPLLAAVLLVPRLSLAVVKAGGNMPVNVLWALLAAGFVLGAYAIRSIAVNLPTIGNARQNQSAFLERCLLPLALSAVLLTTYWAWARSTNQPSPQYWKFALFGAAMHAGGWLVASGILATGFVDFARKFVKTWSLVCAAITGAVGGSLIYGALLWFPDPVAQPKLYTCFAFPALCGIFVLVQFFFVGLASKKTNEEDREWWARSAGWILLTAVGWAVASSIVILGPPLLNKLWAAVVSAGGLGIGGWASLVGFSPKTASGSAASKTPAAPSGISAWARIIAPKIAPVVFLVCLLIVIAYISDRLIQKNTIPALATELLATAAVLLVSLVIANTMGLVINANVFSLHAMYRSRLIRAYLGASNPDRDPNLFTGFDPNDNIPMTRLHRGKPFHVVNIALNLVHGKRLAWQERKAESFTVTRLHAGSARVGYQPVQQYGGDKGITLGTAMAISGAAASPNMGYHSSPLLTFLMTFFNARLGWWLANPGEPGKGLWKNSGPRSAIRAFTDEALGLTDDTDAYVYLSDGGHFENLGLYEMVLRRCRTIVVLDAGADPDFTFEDLGNAIRKIRVDLGIQIGFYQPIELRARKDPQNKRCAVARIQYSCIDQNALDGQLIYIKAALNDRESMDVRQYARDHDSFPHQSTANQFFDESQFESYRRLGLESIDEICGCARQPLDLSQFAQSAVDHSGANVQAMRAAC